MKALEDDTDYKLRTVKESELNLMEIDEPSLRQNLKDRQHGNDYINDVEEGRKRLEQYIKVSLPQNCNSAKNYSSKIMLNFIDILINLYSYFKSPGN